MRWAVVLLLLSLSSGSVAARERVYRYKSRAGRTVYTNDLRRVPPAQRAGAEVDLSHISLNRELGTGMTAEARKQLARALRSPRCAELRDAKERGLLETAWHRHGHLLFAAGVVFVLLVSVPIVVRRYRLPGYGRFVALAIPFVVLVTVMATVFSAADRARRRTRRMAGLCEPTRYLGAPASPAERLSRGRSLEQLMRIVERESR